MSFSADLSEPTISSLSALCAESITCPLSASLISTHLNRPPFIPLSGSLNMRILTSPNLCPGILYRSGTLSQIPATSASQLRTRYKIRTIYDLRRAEEREREPSPVIEGTETIWIMPRSLSRSSPVAEKEDAEEGRLDEKQCTADERKRKRRQRQVEEVPTSAFAEGDGVDAWRGFYANILYTHGHVFKALLERIRDQADGRGGEGGGAVLFHCTAGRDRTGVLAALLLALCRTPRAFIAHDYLLTRIGVEPHRDFLFASLFGTSAANFEAEDEATGGVGKMGTEERKKKEETKARGLRELCEVRESSILAFLDWIGEEWGSSACEGGRSVGGEEQHEEEKTASGVRGWLIDELGFEAADLDRIVERLRSE